jgi:xanthine dehydrogenase YagR molybdenum-binding subunit
VKGDIGKPFDRVDARAKVTGKASYAAEIPVKNVAHAVIVGSPIARGKLVALDTAAAAKLPGVLSILTAENAPRLPKVDIDISKGDRGLQLLQDDRIWYVDQPIAVVVADTLEHAQHAAKSIAVRSEEAAVEVDVNAFVSRAFDPENMGPNGPASSLRGDPATALEGAAHRVERIYKTQVQAHNPMEPHATIAVWQGSSRLTIYDATQGIFNVRDAVAKRFALDPKNVRVISHFLGGGFGCKGAPWSHVVLCAMAARAVGRATKLVVTRQQMFAFVGYRPATIQKLALGADASGKLVAITHDTVAECSRFDRFVEPSGTQSRHLYRCANVSTTHKLVELDVGTPTFTRGPGVTSGTFALECAMDELAYAANIDPLELRRRNYADTDEHENKPYSAKSLLAGYDQASKKFGWAKRTMKPGSMRAGKELVGLGMATVVYPAKQRPASAIARMRTDGSLLVQAGTQEIGTGTYTIMAQIAADALDVPFEKVRFELGDTIFPQTPLSAGSLTAASTGSAVKEACDKLRAQLETMRHAPEESWATIVKRSGRTEVVAQATTEDRKKPYSCHSFGSCFVEVRVDPELGRVRVARIVAAYAAGTILNPKTARSQYIGGLIWGIGFALTENAVRDPRTGRVVTADLADYHLPVYGDIPDIDIIQIPEDDPNMNELGVKGIGEIGVSGITAAIANAVFHATGKRIRELPITLDKLLT